MIRGIHRVYFIKAKVHYPDVHLLSFKYKTFFFFKGAMRAANEAVGGTLQLIF